MIFGVGAGFLVKLFVDGVNKKFNLKHFPETFLRFLTANDKWLLAVARTIGGHSRCRLQA
jgi:hypothetical protein